MKFKSLLGLSVVFAVLLIAGSAYGDNSGRVEYRVINLGNPLGGTGAPAGVGNLGNSINNRGWVAGESDLPGNATMHAELWVYGFPMDLGTLGGPNSAVAWPNHNNRGEEQGEVVGISETAQMNPLGEAWSCGLAVFPTVTGHICRGFVWKDGKMTALATLGGYDGFTTGVNNRGQIVGWAETAEHDPTCNANNQVQQFEAVVWGPGRQHRIHALPLYPGDLDSAATSINQKGQIVGISGLCGGAVGGETAEHMVMWYHDRVAHVLPSLGGSYWNTPMDINNRGDVVGFSDLAGDAVGSPNFHAFFWSRRPFMCGGKETVGTCNLGALPGDFLSEALGVNDHGQVVGVSYPSGQAFIWQNGVMTNLNGLVAPGTTLVLTDAQDINDRGMITGQAYDPATRVFSAFVAIPRATEDDNRAKASSSAR